MGNPPITELNDRTRNILRGLTTIALFLLAACSIDPGSPATDGVDSMEAIRIEATNVWVQEREAFVIKTDGSGFYERYLPFDHDGNALNKVIERHEFAAIAGQFSEVHQNLKEMKPYFGDDISRIDLRRFEGPTKKKADFPCGSKTTDAGAFIVYWNAVHLEDFAKDRNLPDMFVVDRGCQSSDAVGRIERIKTAISTIRQLAGVSAK